MKSKATITKEEEVFKCDFCGKVIPFPTKTCFACGKDTCNEACNYKHMVEFKGGPPAELSTMRYNFGTGILVPTVYFCHACVKKDKIAYQLERINCLNAVFEKSYSGYRREHSALAGRVVKQIEKIEKAKGVTPF